MDCIIVILLILKLKKIIYELMKVYVYRFLLYHAQRKWFAVKTYDCVIKRGGIFSWDDQQ